MKNKIVIALILALTLISFTACGEKNEEQSSNDGTKTETTEDGDKTDGTDDADKEEDTSNVGLTTTFEDEPVLKVEGEEIMLSNAFVYIHQIKTMYPLDVFQNEYEEGVTIEEFFIKELKNILAKQVYTANLAKELGVEITDEDKNKAKEQVDKIFANKAIIQEDVDEMGLTREVVEKVVLASILDQKLFEKMAEDINIEQEKIDEALDHDMNYKMMSTTGAEKLNDSVELRHILVKTIDDKQQPFDDEKKAEAKKKAEEILKRAKDGEDFAELAKENTDDTASKENGGKMTILRGQTVPEFEAAAFELENGEVSELVETMYGYHIIKVENKKLSTPEQIEEAKKQIEEAKNNIIMNLKFQEFMKIYDEKTKDKKVEVIEDGWKRVKILTEEDIKTIEENKKKAEEEAKAAEEKATEEVKEAVDEAEKEAAEKDKDSSKEKEDE